MTIAKECVTLLKDRFGVRQVILFGSLTDQGKWHKRSDIDLAVEGLPPADFFAAYSACRELLPPDLELDLVPLESVLPELRARILQETKMSADPILALKALVEDELIALNRLTQEMEETLVESAQPPTRVELRAIASILHEFYNGVERILERIVISLGEGLPQGGYWHADLLTQTATARQGGRPAIIDEALRARLKAYLDFRHFFRHAYGYNLEWSRLDWLAEQLRETLTMLQGQLQAFFEGLEEN